MEVLPYMNPNGKGQLFEEHLRYLQPSPLHSCICQALVRCVGIALAPGDPDRINSTLFSTQSCLQSRGRDSFKTRVTVQCGRYREGDIPKATLGAGRERQKASLRRYY